jgi:hypothetical protein
MTDWPTDLGHDIWLDSTRLEFKSVEIHSEETSEVSSEKELHFLWTINVEPISSRVILTLSNISDKIRVCITSRLRRISVEKLLHNNVVIIQESKPATTKNIRSATMRVIKKKKGKDIGVTGHGGP